MKRFEVKGVAMRWVLRIVFVAVVLWLAYWFGAAFFIKNQFQAALSEARARGIEAEAELALSGAPARFDLRLSDISLYDPMRDAGWQSPEALISAEAWAPWHLVAALPAVQNFRHAGQSFDLASSDLRASLKLRPLPSLPLDDGRLSAQSLDLSSEGRSLFKSGALILALRHGGGTFYQLGGDIAEIALPAPLREALASTDMPASIDKVSGRVMAELTQPLDRAALRARIGARSLQVDDVQLLWGKLQINANGHLQADAQGLAEGRLALTVKGWQELPPLLVAAKVLPPAYAPLLANFLASLAQQTGGESLTVDLVAKGGKLMLGPLTLAAAPRLMPEAPLP